MGIGGGLEVFVAMKCFHRVLLFLATSYSRSAAYLCLMHDNCSANYYKRKKIYAKCNTLTVSVNKNQNYAAFNNNPYKSVLLGLGSDVGIIIEGSIILIFVDRNC